MIVKAIVIARTTFLLSLGMLSCSAPLPQPSPSVTAIATLQDRADSGRDLPRPHELITSFGEDADGELYVTTEAGSVYKIVVQ